MGIDYHKQYSRLRLVDKEGKVIKAARVDNLRRDVE